MTATSYYYCERQINSFCRLWQGLFDYGDYGKDYGKWFGKLNKIKGDYGDYGKTGYYDFYCDFGYSGSTRIKSDPRGIAFCHGRRGVPSRPTQSAAPIPRFAVATVVTQQNQGVTAVSAVVTPVVTVVTPPRRIKLNPSNQDYGK